MEKPTQTQLQALGISQAYASLILSGGRIPSRPLAIKIFRELNWKHDVIADLTAEQIDILEEVEPWTPREAA